MRKYGRKRPDMIFKISVITDVDNAPKINTAARRKRTARRMIQQRCPTDIFENSSERSNETFFEPIGESTSVGTVGNEGSHQLDRGHLNRSETDRRSNEHNGAELTMTMGTSPQTM